MNNRKLENLINKKLKSKNYKDQIFNGLQIEGQSQIKKIITGVTASKKLINIAIKKKAQAIIVHHGYFWNNKKIIIDKITKNRLRLIFSKNINLYCWHLPLDLHKKLGNNTQLGKKLNIIIKGKISSYVWWGILKKKISGIKFCKKIFDKFNRKPLYIHDNIKSKIKKIGWCSGKGQKFIDQAIKFGVDAYLTGEVSEETTHSAIESKIHFFSIGHHASEIGGIKSLSKWIKKKVQINIEFINIPNPV
ncbi:Nif3-like dinuclear metal center hexameric protein [Buchnera aphidicola]|uniref:Nif3-like dinuclear metal center hexameric protein n=1 Tax=Buchnera aphidicola TaxID=9 RepID=UPI0030EDDB83